MIEALPAWPVFGFSDDVRPALRAVLEAGRPAALATITGLKNGGPRPVGTQMVVGGDVVSGFLSGGCLEADVAGHAEQVLADGRPRRLVYGEGSPWPDIRLMCGARIDILLERVPPDDAAAASLLALGAARTPALWTSDGLRRSCGPLDGAPPRWSAEAFHRVHWPVPRLVVLGSDPSALAIASLGVQAGWETTLVRPSGPSEPPPLAGIAYRREAPGAALAAIGLDAWTAVAVASHDAEVDHAALAVALPSPAFYVGALGARRRRAERAARLLQAGLSAREVDRLHSPIGLELGGKAPWDVAIGVLAQITAERRAREAEGEVAGLEPPLAPPRAAIS